jgi:acetate kinase
MKILIANIGSTSLKYRLFDFSNGQERMLVRGGFDRVTDYSSAINSCLQQLEANGWIASDHDLSAVGFKPVLAREVTGCVLMDDNVLEAMDRFAFLAPAHNPPYINGIRLFKKRIPDVPMVGLFETAFYQWMPDAAKHYAIPEHWYKAGLRRWGFHGASHKFVAERTAELMGRDDIARRVKDLYVNNGSTPIQRPDLRVISCHLGGSSSVTGILNGLAIGSSMGLSPQSGLPQNNRVGDLDAFAVPFIVRELGVNIDDACRLMCKESGLKGLSGGLNDMRDILAAIEQGNTSAQLAFDVYIWSIRHWLGAFLVLLNGVDAIAFTGGIGENNPLIRKRVCSGLEELGIQVCEEVNSRTMAEEALLSSTESRVKIFLIPANEELVVAREVKRFLEVQKLR